MRVKRCIASVDKHENVTIATADRKRGERVYWSEKVVAQVPVLQSGSAPACLGVHMFRGFAVAANGET